MIGLDQLADVYTANGSTGDYTVLAKSGLACRLVASRSSGSPADERADPVTTRFLMWGAAYVMPANVQVVVDSVRYTIEENTVVAVRNGLSQVEYRKANVVTAI